MNRRLYTKEEVEKIKQWRSEGCTMKEIAERLDRSVGSICSVCERLSVPRSRVMKSEMKWSKERINTLCAHYERGDSRKHLAEEFGVTENTISVVLSHARHIGLMSAYRNIGRPRTTEVNN